MIASEYRAWFAGLHRLEVAGVSLSRSAPEALAALRNEAFRQKLARAIQPLAYHKPLSDVVGRLPALPRELGVLLASAESCCELEAGLLQASARCSEAEHAGRQRLGWVLAMGSYALAASYVAARLVLFSVDQFSRIVQ